MRKQAYEKAGIWQRAHTESEAKRKIEPKSADFKTVFFSLFFFNPRLLFKNRKKSSEVLTLSFQVVAASEGNLSKIFTKQLKKIIIIFLLQNGTITP